MARWVWERGGHRATDSRLPLLERLPELHGCGASAGLLAGVVVTTPPARRRDPPHAGRRRIVLYVDPSVRAVPLGRGIAVYTRVM